MSLPDRRATRTLRPSSSLRNPIRVGLPSESTTITLLTWIGASCVTMPPERAPRWVVDTRVSTTQRGARTGGIVTQEAPIHVSNVMVVDSDGKPTRIGYRKDEDGRSVRIGRRSGKDI